jgi:hypothetical protein
LPAHPEDVPVVGDLDIRAAAKVVTTAGVGKRVQFVAQSSAVKRAVPIGLAPRTASPS